MTLPAYAQSYQRGFDRGRRDGRRERPPVAFYTANGPHVPHGLKHDPEAFCDGYQAGYEAARGQS